MTNASLYSRCYVLIFTHITLVQMAPKRKLITEPCDSCKRLKKQLQKTTTKLQAQPDTAEAKVDKYEELLRSINRIIKKCQEPESLGDGLSDLNEAADALNEIGLTVDTSDSDDDQ